MSKMTPLEALDVVRQRVTDVSLERDPVTYGQAQLAVAVLAEVVAGTNTASCLWCGHVGPKDREAIARHMSGCEKWKMAAIEIAAPTARAITLDEVSAWLSAECVAARGECATEVGDALAELIEAVAQPGWSFEPSKDGG